jgi:hypothetical protein
LLGLVRFDHRILVTIRWFRQSVVIRFIRFYLKMRAMTLGALASMAQTAGFICALSGLRCKSLGQYYI